MRPLPIDRFAARRYECAAIMTMARPMMRRRLGEPIGTTQGRLGQILAAERLTAQCAKSLWVQP